MIKIWNNKLLLFKILIVFVGMLSLICLFTAKVYIYTSFSLKAFGWQLWLGIIMWLLFCFLVVIFTRINSAELDSKINKLKLYLKKVCLLLMITILLAYQIGGAIIKLYKLSNMFFNIIIYVLFGLVFITYAITTFIINKKYLVK